MKLKLDFDINTVNVTEFGVGRDDRDQQVFGMVPVDAKVQKALCEMVRTTWDAMQKDEDGPAIYEPSEKHASTDYLYLPLSDDLATPIRDLHQAQNLPIDSSVLAKVGTMFCYFARLTDKKDKRLTALRRATQFKGVLKSRLLRLVSDSLQLVEDRVFKLDNDFDLLADSANLHILRPSGFEFAGKLQQAILGAVPENIKEISKDLPFVDFSGIESFACKHPRAARYLASIRSLGEMKNIDKKALIRNCENTGVKVKESNGKIIVADGHEMGFLEVLDRRRYEVNLVHEKPERYLAPSRRKIEE